MGSTESLWELYWNPCLWTQGKVNEFWSTNGMVRAKKSIMMIAISVWWTYQDLKVTRSHVTILILNLQDSHFHIVVMFHSSFYFLVWSWLRWWHYNYCSSNSSSSISIYHLYLGDFQIKKIKLFTQRELNALIRNLALSKEVAEILGSHLSEHHVLDTVVKGFLSKKKVHNDQELVIVMSIKIRYLFIQFYRFIEKLSDVTEDQWEHFHQGIETMDKW